MQKDYFYFTVLHSKTKSDGGCVIAEIFVPLCANYTYVFNPFIYLVIKLVN